MGEKDGLKRLEVKAWLVLAWRRWVSAEAWMRSSSPCGGKGRPSWQRLNSPSSDPAKKSLRWDSLVQGQRTGIVGGKFRRQEPAPHDGGGGSRIPGLRKMNGLPK